jgi:hypothetical protein
VDEGSFEEQFQETTEQTQGYPEKERPAADKLAYHQSGPVRHGHAFLAGNRSSESPKKQTERNLFFTALALSAATRVEENWF